MDDIHLSRELLRAVSRGELPVKLLSQVGLQHLMDLCPYCQREIRAWQRELQGGAVTAENFDLLPSFRSETTGSGHPVLQAAAEMRELLALPHEERLRKVRQARTRFRSPVLARLLLEGSRERVHGDPGESFNLAELALTVASYSPQMPHIVEFTTLTAAAMGNACRAGAGLKEAEQHFRYARSIIRGQGVTDPEVLARVDDLEGSLCKDQRLFSRAEELLSRAAMLYRLIGDQPGIGRVLLILASTYNLQGLTSRAIETVEAALKQIKRASEPRLFLFARHNLALYLTEADRPLDAADIVAADMGLYREFPDKQTQLHLSWLYGKIAMGLEDYANAEEAFLSAQRGFMAEGMGYDAALVSLDLALLYLRQRRTRELQELVEAAVPIFASQDIHREAAAALMLFQDAVRHDAITATLVEEVVRYLKVARNDPSLRFREPS